MRPGATMNVMHVLLIGSAVIMLYTHASVAKPTEDDTGKPCVCPRKFAPVCARDSRGMQSDEWRRGCPTNHDMVRQQDCEYYHATLHKQNENRKYTFDSDAIDGFFREVVLKSDELCGPGNHFRLTEPSNAEFESPHRSRGMAPEWVLALPRAPRQVQEESPVLSRGSNVFEICLLRVSSGATIVEVPSVATRMSFELSITCFIAFLPGSSLVDPTGASPIDLNGDECVKAPGDQSGPVVDAHDDAYSWLVEEEDSDCGRVGHRRLLRCHLIDLRPSSQRPRGGHVIGGRAGLFVVYAAKCRSAQKSKIRLPRPMCDPTTLSCAARPGGAVSAKLVGLVQSGDSVVRAVTRIRRHRRCQRPRSEELSSPSYSAPAPLKRLSSWRLSVCS
ncbi:hypothetical protein BIW11_13629 [Tropilaelaps mercedesae]|uniref:Uncharacterized protein n=1 Tax=Tropilaelaps mercedesae TaxID=418985 RepID=A0A1V9X1H1_9ACAR|nr:hypothetical protein BIW11_13629 [Tropilaelaps mercedesae]